MIDASKETTDSTITEIKDLIKKDLHSYNLSSTHSRIGIVTFASSPNTLIGMRQGVSNGNVKNALENIQISPTTADMKKAFDFIRNSFDWANSGRKSVPQVVVLFTTSPTGNIPPQVIRSANKLKETVKLIIIGVGDKLKTSELNKLASDKDYVNVAKRPKDLSNLISGIKKAIAESTS